MDREKLVQGGIPLRWPHLAVKVPPLTRTRVVGIAMAIAVAVAVEAKIIATTQLTKQVIAAK
jgi:hypothetical protein